MAKAKKRPISDEDIISNAFCKLCDACPKVQYIDMDDPKFTVHFLNDEKPKSSELINYKPFLDEFKDIISSHSIDGMFDRFAGLRRGPFTPNPLHRLYDFEILVYPTDRIGSLDKSSISDLKETFGAQEGVVGKVTGQSYGIPVMDASGKPLPVESIGNAISAFLKVAYRNQNRRFYVTDFGTSKNKFPLKEFVPLFSEELEKIYVNIALPTSWHKYL